MMDCGHDPMGNDDPVPDSARRPAWSRMAVAVVIVIAAAAAGGCGRGDQPPLGRVSGTVTLDGRPLAGVEVSFAPDTGRPSIAVTNASGVYELTYVGTTRGAKVGTHRVSINHPLVSDEEGDGRTARGPRIPPRYNAATTLTANVTPSRNTIDFALESK
jgi:hypothetical protein